MLNNLEKNIVSRFIQNLDEHENEIMTLIWNDGSRVKALFDTCFEDENDYEADDEKYEEFMSFAFTMMSVNGNPPVDITEDKCFLVSYHNFPDAILLSDGTKIN